MRTKLNNLPFAYTIAGLTAVYFAAGKLGLALAFVHPSASAIWPCSGIALAAFLVLGYQVWPGIFLGAFLANITTAGSVSTSLGISMGNTLEGLAGAYLVNRFANGRHAFERPQDFLKFAVLAGMLSTAVSATFGVTSLSLGGFANWANYGSIWLTWWLGDAAGDLIVAPLLILWSVYPHPRLNRSQVFEATIMLLLLVLVSLVAFGKLSSPLLAYYPLIYWCLPIFVWTAYRFGERETATAIFVFSVVAIWGTLHGYGRFARTMPNDSLLLLQTFMCVTAVMAMGFAAVVSERRRAEEASARLAAIVESSDDAIIGKTLDGIVTSWNKGAERIFGYTAEEIMGKPVTVLIPSHRDEEEPRIIKRLKRGDHIEHYETVRRRKNGHEIQVSLTISPIKDATRKIIGISTVARDITERKRAEAALQESEARFRVMADTAPVLVWTSGPDALCNFFNKPWLEFTGQTLEHELGNGWAEDIHPEDRERCLEIYRSAFDVHKEFKMEYRLRRADGEYRWILDNGVPRYESDGTFAGYIGSCMDITEDKRVADEIRRLNVELEQRVFERTAQLEAANKELESFSYSVSHDLRAPLRSIDGFSLALLEDCADKLDAQGKDYLRRVRDATQRMARLIDDLLNLARVTREEMRRDRVDLSALARSIAADLKKTQPGRKVTFTIEDGVVANGDARLLRVALENLLGNAWKFTSKRPRTTIEFGITKQNGKPAAYFVRDDGAGFDIAYARKLFGAFQRLHSSNEFEGTGIGLATVKRVIRRHGGHVWAESAEGQGATFYFTLQPSEGSRQTGVTR
ncbi:MAG TPA: MASE1 domain-containing protein [Nitrospiraceae bacterium]|nr:MASE1 domain-containing protein [Nitrospiraceae bacterium]